MKKIPFGFALIFCLLLLFIPSVSSDSSGQSGNEETYQQANSNEQVSPVKKKKQSKKRRPESYEDIQAREEWFYRQRAYPYDSIPPGARQQAIEYMNTHMQSETISPSIIGNAWEPVGPDFIPDGQVEPFLARDRVSGRVTALAKCCGNNKIILGSALGGIWISSDNGYSWSPRTDNQPEFTLPISSIVFDPTNTQIIYAGTGSSSYRGDGYFGSGILKSTDGGISFKQMAATTFARLNIADLAINPTDPKILYAGTTEGKATTASTGGGFADDPGPNNLPGVYKIEDEKKGWKRLPGSPSGNISKVQIDPTNSNFVYAALNDSPFYGGVGKSVIFKSVDNGINWSRLGDFIPNTNKRLGRVSFQIAPSNSNIIYAAVEDVVTRGLLDNKLFKSTDGGQNWTPLTNSEDPTNGFDCNAFFTNVIAVSPVNPDIVFFGGTFLYRSIDGGRTWSSRNGIGKIHVDVHAIVFDPQSPGRVYIGTDGGVWYSLNSGESWQNINGNLSITQFNYIAADPKNGIILGGTQDNGALIRRSRNSRVWNLADQRGGDGGPVLIDPKFPNIYYNTGANRNDLFSRSNNSGRTWTTLRPPVNVTADRLLFYFPVAMDPSNTQTLYLGSKRLFKTNTGGLPPAQGVLGWFVPTTNQSLDLTKTGQAPHAISAIAVGVNTSNIFGPSNIVYVGTSDGNLQVSTDGGTTFTPKITNLPNRYITRIAVDPTNPKIAYATFSGFGIKHVYKTTNGGDSWNPISGNLPDIPVNCLVIDKTKPNKLYIGTDIGVFVTEDGGANWSRVGSKSITNMSLPNTVITDLVIDNATNTLLASTYGRGVWMLRNQCPNISLFPSIILAGIVGETYSRVINAAGGTVPYTFSITSGNPPGLKLENPTGSSITLTGKPVFGKFEFTITVVDSNGCPGSKSFNITVRNPPNPSPPTIPNGVVGAAYGQTFTVNDGITPYSFAVTAGTLPDGLTLSPTGTLSGTFTTAGDFSFTITSTDADNNSGSQEYTLKVTTENCPTITLNPSTLPNGSVGVAYNQTITTTDGSAPYTFAVKAGALPAGLTLSASGLLSGTTTTEGSFRFTVRAVDANGCAGSQAYTITVGCAAALILTPADLPDGMAGVAYNQTITASDGTAPYTFAVTSDTLPIGLTLSSSGVLSGTPFAGNYNFTITATDANGCSFSQLYGLTIGCPAITLTPTLPNGSAGVAFNQAIAASGGTAPYTFIVALGSIPDGLTLSPSGILFGSPVDPGEFAFTIEAIDANSCIGSQDYTMIVDCRTITLSPATLPNVVAGESYNQTVTASGGASPYSFAVTSGQFPIGLILSSTGGIFRVPTIPGNYTFTMSATDSNGCTGSQDYTIRVLPKVELSPETLPNGNVGVAYNQTIVANGGTSPYTFTSTGTLPTGLTLSSSGTLSGTPTAAGRFSFTVIATDAGSNVGSRDYTIIICGTIVLSPSELPNGIVGVAYNQTITASGSATPYTFTVSVGTLPAGLTLSSSGTLSGTPTTAGSFIFTVKAADANGCARTLDYTITITSGCPTITLSPTTLPNGTVGIAYNQTITASGGTAPYTFTVSTGTLPTGLTLSSSGTLSGTPTTAGSFTFTVKATDAKSCIGSLAYTINIPQLPGISGFSPASGALGSNVTISGANFTGATAVKFNGVSATFTVVSDTSIDAIVPSGATTGPISVTTPGGTATSSTNFTVAASGPPTITSFTPANGAADEEVTISGTNFTGTTAVKFNNVSTTFTVTSNSSIKAAVPMNAITGRITVTNPLGTATSATNFIIKPKVVSFTPTSGPVGTQVTITGSAFSGVIDVKFNGVSGTGLIFVSNTTVKATVPSTASTGPISVIATDGTGTSSTNFLVEPRVSSFTPIIGPVGTLVTITGSGFTTDTTVKFNGVTSTSVTFVSANSIKATVPPGATKGNITVENIGGTTLSAAIFKVTPKIDSFTPASGPVGASVTITGSTFINITDVKFGTVSATFTVNSPTQITATVPSGAVTATISVTNADGTGTSATSFTIISPPVISSFTPATGPVGTLVTISGTNLSSVTDVKFNDVSAESITIVSASSIKANVPAGATTGKISVTNPAGTALSTTIYKVTPKIESFTPTSGLVGASVTITGTTFLNITSVKFGTVTASFTVDSPTQITAIVPSGGVTATISVTNADGTGTSAASFTVISSPTISSFTPAAGPIGTLVTITGTNLSTVTDVKFNGVSAGSITIVSATSIKANVPVGASTGKISVTNPAGTAMSTAIFKVMPQVDSFTPASGPAGTSVTITGTTFNNATAVKFGTAIATFTIDSPTQITAIVPSGAVTATISVTNPDGTDASATSFVVLPRVDSFTPTSATTGTSITITGMNFTGATSVTFNNVNATTFTVASATSISATVPATATTGRISVTTPDGTGTSATDFIVLPKITSFTPASGAVDTLVTITGSGITADTTVQFNGVSSTSVTFVSVTSIKATVPAGATTGKIGVINPAGTAMSASNFTVLPKITSFSPTSALPGASVTITGTSFTGATAVKFNNVVATFTVDSSTQITAIVPATATTGTITVTTPSGTATSSSSFTVIKQPTITSFSPTSGAVGITVTITGTNYIGTTEVKFNGVSASFTVVSATSITATVPAGATMGKISVTNPAGTATSTNNFTVTP
jgi:hypothetical protein